MENEYRYRKHIRWGQYIIPISFGILIICLWGIIGIILLFSKKAYPLTLLFVLICFSFVFFFEGILLWYLYYRMAGISILLKDEGIIYKYRKGEKRIPFDSIYRLVFPSVQYIGGWIKIISRNDTIRLTVVVENIGDFLQKLKVLLDNRGLSDRYEKAKFFRFLKTSVYADQSWARLYSIFWKLILISILNGVIGFVFATLGQFDFLGTGTWIIISLFWPTAVYLSTEIVFGRWIAKKSVEDSFTCPPRDIVVEQSVYRKAVLIGALLYIGIFAILTVMIFV